MEDLGLIIHEEFEFLLIPKDINDSVQTLKFKGREKQFREQMNAHFRKEIFQKADEKAFANSLTQKYQENNLSEDQISAIVSSAQTYQIISLTLPTRENHYEAINCYIDEVGRLKQLPSNARASRICSTDICGDCFISKTFDDDKDFKRISFTMKDYEVLLSNPPVRNRRSEMQALLGSQSNQRFPPSPSSSVNVAVPEVCSNCGKSSAFTTETSSDGKEASSTKKLLACGRCHRVKYCSAVCQRMDWQYHKRICH